MADYVPQSNACAACVRLCRDARIFSNPVKISIDGLRDDCWLCRFLCSLSAFAQRLQIDALHSYDIRVNDLAIPTSTPTKEWRVNLMKDPLKTLVYSTTPTPSYTISARFPDEATYEGGLSSQKIFRSASIHSRLPIQRHFDTSYGGQHTRETTGQDIIKQNLEAVLKNISNCQRTHKFCSSPIGAERKDRTLTEFPSVLRLVKIEKTGDGDLPRLQLVSFSENIPTYITLSHRWSNSQPTRTTSANERDYKNSIPYDNLPKTFRDAIQMVIWLSVEYIWIDSLCIIQENEDDWRIQSEQMGLIYETSLCTLGAVDAHSSSETDNGLFPNSNILACSVQLENHYDVQFDQKIETADGPSYLVKGKGVDVGERSEAAWQMSSFRLEPSLASFEVAVERSAWNRRAWIFQERVLSSRIIYFTEEQAFWECAESSGSPVGVPLSQDRGIARSHGLHNDLRRINELCLEISPAADDKTYGDSFYELWDEYQRFKVWCSLVERYSICELTHSTDKWYAIAGLCEILQSYFQSSIHAGIWSGSVGACLLWHAKDAPLQSYGDYEAPSWSWLGVNGAVTFIYHDESYVGYAQKVKTLYQDPEFLISDRGRRGFDGTLQITCLATQVGVSDQWSTFRFGEFTGQSQDPPAWKIFHDLSHGRSQLELSREYANQSIPRRARLLTVDGRIIGWVVMDREEPLPAEVVCAAIAIRVLNNFRLPEQHIVECVMLVESSSTPGLHTRVGRGRLVERSLLSSCIPQRFCIA